MPKDGDKHVCDRLRKNRSLNDITVQYEKWSHSPGGWTINIDGGGESSASEWIDWCPFCGTKLEV